MTHRWWNNSSMFYNPLSLSMRMTLSSMSYRDQVKDFTLLHSIGFIIVDEIENLKARNINFNENINEIELTAFIQADTTNVNFQNPLILILVESLENDTQHRIIADKSRSCLFPFSN